MSRKVGIGVAILAVVLGWLILAERHGHPENSAPKSAAVAAGTNSPFSPVTVDFGPSTTTTSAPSATLPAGNLASVGVAPEPVQDNSATIPAAVVLQNVRRAVRQYGDMFNGNPVGTNPEITAALSGKNPRQINFIDGEGGMRVNGNGEMIDPWGTPYFFHQISGSEMEIHSAGPDRIMWTADDLVAR